MCLYSPSYRVSQEATHEKENDCSLTICMYGLWPPGATSMTSEFPCHLNS